jgi:hypothetical protein
LYGCGTPEFNVIAPVKSVADSFDCILIVPFADSVPSSEINRIMRPDTPAKINSVPAPPCVSGTLVVFPVDACFGILFSPLGRFRGRPPHRRITLQSNFRVFVRPAFAGFVQKYNPLKVMFVAVVNQKMRVTAPVGRFDGQRRI